VFLAYLTVQAEVPKRRSFSVSPFYEHLSKWFKEGIRDVAQNYGELSRQKIMVGKLQLTIHCSEWIQESHKRLVIN
jgi:hypothetical protein